MVKNKLCDKFWLKALETVILMEFLEVVWLLHIKVSTTFLMIFWKDFFPPVIVFPFWILLHQPVWKRQMCVTLGTW